MIVEWMAICAECGAQLYRDSVRRDGTDALCRACRRVHVAAVARWRRRGRASITFVDASGRQFRFGAQVTTLEVAHPTSPREFIERREPYSANIARSGQLRNTIIGPALGRMVSEALEPADDPEPRNRAERRRRRRGGL